MLLALTFKDTNVTLTLTGGKGTGQENILNDYLADAGAEIMLKNSGEICVDYNNKVVSTPAYINDATLAEVYTGIELLVNHIVENC
jgi:enhancing lycopene biosynthesis protein 2